MYKKLKTVIHMSCQCVANQSIFFTWSHNVILYSPSQKAREETSYFNQLPIWWPAVSRLLRKVQDLCSLGSARALALYWAVTLPHHCPLFFSLYRLWSLFPDHPCMLGDKDFKKRSLYKQARNFVVTGLVIKLSLKNAKSVFAVYSFPIIRHKYLGAKH